jgi:uncharacterized protein (TIGR03435 family)
MIMYAYGIANLSYQISGTYRLPDGWNWYDVEAIAPGSPNDSDLRLMFQSLLEDRFGLKVHHETRELPQYDLLPAKGGAKLKPASPDSQITVDGKRARTGVAGGVDGSHLIGTGATTDQLAASLSGLLRAPVRDRTGLTGAFDYNVLFSRDDVPTGVEGPPPLTTAIHQELGLRLEPTKGPVDVLVIDHLEKPTPN